MLAARSPAAERFHPQPTKMLPLRLRVALLLFGSGMCALVYEVVWFRGFRLVFGASTAANAAVLAVFVGGLGAGGLLLGKRADRAKQPILLYANLELIAAGLAALTPVLLLVTRKAYIAMGGAAAVGATGATILRLLLTTLVLLAPTFVMGGTLPAAVRGIETDSDDSRRAVGLLYGVNTLGAVCGCVIANFILLEAVGTRWTLWFACVANVIVALAARTVARDAASAKAPASEGKLTSPELSEPAENFAPTASAAASTSKMPTSRSDDSKAEEASGSPPAIFVLIASAGVGFAFFLMELVWYRMLGPLLGGTVFTFGIILAVALFGIGIGGMSYALLGSDRRATMSGFAFTCLIEALFLAIPYALGDRLATVALLLRPLGSMRFLGLALGWTMVTTIVVLPAAFVAGVQFPLLIGLLGRGSNKVGAHTGLAYAANTGGAIAGALAGGFGLLPALSLLGCWRLVAWMLTALGVFAALWVLRQTVTSWLRPLIQVAIAAAVILLLDAEGPTSVWRHGQIGVGRVPDTTVSTPNSYIQWANVIKRAIRWERDGDESSVAVDGRAGLAFIVNGKSDGHARADAATQVMMGMVGALLHPSVKRAMVIGLGTGSSAGWLGALPDIERVDVAELEPAILHVAELASPVNRDVLHNPRVHVVIGDARETLLTSRERYDIIASEPSNPYRAGVASLYTREFYEAVLNRLSDDGIFLQWVQAYDVDNQTLRTVYATLASVFKVDVETWELQVNDLLLVASRKKMHHDLNQIRERIKQEPFRTALFSAWRATDAESVFAHYVARGSFAKAVAFVEKETINTDDHNLIEFGFARSVRGKADNMTSHSEQLRALARERKEAHPADLEKELDWARVEDNWVGFRAAEGNPTAATDQQSPPQRALATAYMHFLGGRLSEAAQAFRTVDREPRNPIELAMLASSIADTGDDAAESFIEQLRVVQPVEADSILARLRFRQHRYAEGAAALDKAFIGHRTDPWPLPVLLRHALETADQLMVQEPSTYKVLRPSLEKPFIAFSNEEDRRTVLVGAAFSRPIDSSCAQILAPFEPHPLWQKLYLDWRARCYAFVHHAAAARAAEDLEEFNRNLPSTFDEGLNLPRPTIPAPRASAAPQGGVVQAGAAPTVTAGPLASALQERAAKANAAASASAASPIVAPSARAAASGGASDSGH